jgi:hypothetical protein
MMMIRVLILVVAEVRADTLSLMTLLHCLYSKLA